MSDDTDFMARAFAMAQKSAGEGGVPVGACLAHGSALVAEGHNRRQQEGTIILHGETDCLRQAGLFGRWPECTMYTTLSPCMMCAGTIVQFRIPRVVIGDNVNFGGNEEFLRARGGRGGGAERAGDDRLFRGVDGGESGDLERRYRGVGAIGGFGERLPPVTHR